MKKILLLFLMISTISSAAEIFEEFYVMEKVIPLLQKTSTKKLNRKKIKMLKVDRKVLKAIETTSTVFYIFDSNGKKSKVKVGDYLISPVTLSEIYVVPKEKLERIN